MRVALFAMAERWLRRSLLLPAKADFEIFLPRVCGLL